LTKKQMGMPLTMESVSESECPGCRSTSFSQLSWQEFLSRCSDCGLVFDNPRPTTQAIAAHYSQETQYDGWIQNLKDRDRLWRRRIRKMRRHRSPGSLLDVGTGIGQLLHHARTEYHPVQGIEISSTAIELAKRLYQLDILKGSIEFLDIHHRFDNITAFHVLEHVHHPGEFLERCNQLLKPGGRLFLAVPNELEALGVRMGRHSLQPIELSNSEIHLSHFTMKSMAELLRLSGLEVICLSLDPFWVVPPSRERLQGLRYYGMGALLRLTGLNLYPTIWAVAQKPLRASG
jgi:2-polyprenyl-3-methyl-5-hydroxy-6-metoxy-1,4-benzoquinol methylase